MNAHHQPQTWNSTSTPPKVKHRGVTRLSVIDHRRVDPATNKKLPGMPVRGLVVEAWDVQVESMLQDDGRTLKVWITDPPTGEEASG